MTLTFFSNDQSCFSGLYGRSLGAVEPVYTERSELWVPLRYDNPDPRGPGEPLPQRVAVPQSDRNSMLPHGDEAMCR